MTKELQFDASTIEKIAAKTVLDIPGVLATQGSAVNLAVDQVLDMASEVKQSLSDDVSEIAAEEHKKAQRALTSGVLADIDEAEVALDINLVVEYGSVIPDIYQEVLRRVPENILMGTGLRVAKLKVHIQDIVKKSDFQQVYYKQF